MFNGISWGDYIFFMATCLFFYYIAVLFLFYRADIIYKFFGDRDRTFFTATGHEHEAGRMGPEQTEQLFGMAIALSQNIKGAFSQLETEQTDYPAFLESIQRMIRDNRALKDTPFMVSINNVLREEAARQHISYLDNDGIEGLWEKG